MAMMFPDASSITKDADRLDCVTRIVTPSTVRNVLDMAHKRGTIMHVECGISGISDRLRNVLSITTETFRKSVTGSPSPMYIMDTAKGKLVSAEIFPSTRADVTTIETFTRDNNEDTALKRMRGSTLPPVTMIATFSNTLMLAVCCGATSTNNSSLVQFVSVYVLFEDIKKEVLLADVVQGISM